MIRQLELVNENYKVAVHMLKGRYADRIRIVETQYSQIQKLFPQFSQYLYLRTLFDNFEMHLRFLEALEAEEVNTQQILRLLRSKILSDMFFELDFRKDDEEWTLHSFREALEIYI